MAGDADGSNAMQTLPAPLTVEDLKERLADWRAASNPTKASTGICRAYEQSTGCGLLDDCYKNMINARMGKSNHLNFKVTLLPKAATAGDTGRAAEITVQFEFAAGAPELQGVMDFAMVRAAPRHAQTTLAKLSALSDEVRVYADRNHEVLVLLLGCFSFRAADVAWAHSRST